MDCRPFRYRNIQFISNKKACEESCPYYDVCTKRYKKLSQEPEAIMSRKWREFKHFLIINENS
uniref:Uncharacterized protein n=1 Tax=viral metagenome TaxID=1070528 RepID=A0A6M3II12_9ZZZZ